MELPRRVMPLVLSGTLAFGTMGVPLSAYAVDYDDYDDYGFDPYGYDPYGYDMYGYEGYDFSAFGDAEYLEADLAARVATEEGFTQEMADALLAEYYLQVEAENAAMLAAMEEEEKAKEAAEKEAAEQAAAEQAAAEQAAAEQAAAEQAAAEQAAAEQAQQEAEQQPANADAEPAAEDSQEQQEAPAQDADADAAIVATGEAEDTAAPADGEATDGEAAGEATDETATDGEATDEPAPGDATDVPASGDTTDPAAGETPDNSQLAAETADAIKSFLGAESVVDEGVANLATTLADLGSVPAGQSLEFTFTYVFQGVQSSRTFIATPQEDGSIEIRDTLSGLVVTTIAPPAVDADAEAEADKQADQKAYAGKHARAFEQGLVVDGSKVEDYEQAAHDFADELKEKADSYAADAIGSSYDPAFTGINAGYSRVRYTTNLTTGMFIASIGEQARQIGQEKHLYASVMIAQAIIESDSGNSGLARAPYNNLFGIKGSYKGKSVTMATQEDNGYGNLYNIDAAFRAYDTTADSLADYAELLRGDMGHYYHAWKENAKTYKEAAKALQGTYATSTIYADTICAVIEAYDLTRFDKPLDFKITGKDAKGQKLTMDDYAELEANAVSFLGTPYVWGGTTPDGFDCSGFVQYLYKQTFGIDLPRTTYTQQYEGKEVAFQDLQMGDLLFFDEGGSTEHVAMYLNDGFYIHAPEPGDAIKITPMETFMPTFAKRIIKTEKVTKGAVKIDVKAAKKATSKVTKAVAEEVSEGIVQEA